MKKHLFITFSLFLFQLVLFAQSDIAISNEKPDKKLFVTSDSLLGVVIKDGNLKLYINESGMEAPKSIIVSFNLSYQKNDDFMMKQIRGNIITVQLLDEIMDKKYKNDGFYISDFHIKNINKGKIQVSHKSIKVSFPNR